MQYLKTRTFAGLAGVTAALAARQAGAEVTLLERKPDVLHFQRGSQLRHVISNLIVQVDGDRGHATCYLTVFLTRDGQSRLLAPGQYDCELRKVDGVWRFQNRVVRHDHDYTLDGL